MYVTQDLTRKAKIINGMGKKKNKKRKTKKKTGALKGYLDKVLFMTRIRYCS